MSSRLLCLVALCGCGIVSPDGQNEEPLDQQRETLVASQSSMVVARDSFTLTKLADGRVLAVGGRDQTGMLLSSAEIYNPTTQTWTPTGSLSNARSGHTATLLADGSVLVAGGYGASGFLASSERFSPVSGTWALTQPMSARIAGGAAVRLNNGRVLMTGGNITPRLAQVFDPTTNSWSVTGALLNDRGGHCATLLTDGRVLVTGGGLNPSSERTAEIYSPATGTFIAAASPSVGKGMHVAVRLADGRVLTISPESEVYDPATNSWSPAPSSTHPRSLASAVLMGDGSVLFAGGTSSLLERFAANTWSTVGHVSRERTHVGAALLDDGRVLLAGGAYVQWTVSGSGASGTFVATATADIYDAAVQSLSVYDPSLRVPRCSTVQAECDTAGQLSGRGAAPYIVEPNAPNTINGSCADSSAGYGLDEFIDAIRIRSLSGGPLTAGQGATVQVTVRPSTTMASQNAIDVYLSNSVTTPVWEHRATLPVLAVGLLQDVSTNVTLGTAGHQAVRVHLRRGSSPSPCSVTTNDDHDDLVFAVSVPADTQPPIVAFMTPSASAVISNQPVTLGVAASDNFGVTRVEYYNGTTLLGTNTAFPFSLSASLPAGPITVTARAYDAAGNSSTATRSFTIDRTAPTVQLTSPSNGAVLTSGTTITLSANAFDNIGVSRVQFHIYGTLLFTDTTAPFSTIVTPTITGNTTISAVAIDQAGNATWHTINVSVSAGSQTVVPLASYDAALRAPSCRAVGTGCDSASLLNGRAALGPEAGAPNTINSSCADGTSGMYHLDESLDRLRVVTVDGSPLRAGALVRVEATVWTYSTTANKLDIFRATDANSPSWTLVATLSPSVMRQGVLSTTFVLPAGGLQAIRGQFRYGGSTVTPCMSSGYNDRDDLIFAVAP